MPVQYVVAPNTKQVDLEWRESGGDWQPVAFKTETLNLPFKLTPTTEIDMNGGYRISVHVTEFEPLPTGSVELYGITPTATTYSLRDAVLNENGGSAATPTNATATIIVDSAVRCFDLRATIDQGSTRGGVYRVTMTAVEIQFAAGPKPSPTGWTYDAALRVHGSIVHELPA